MGKTTKTRLLARCKIGAKNARLVVGLTRDAGFSWRGIMLLEIIIMIMGVTLAFLAASQLAEYIRSEYHFVEGLTMTSLEYNSYWTVITIQQQHDWLGIITYTSTIIVAWAISVGLFALLIKTYLAVLESAWQDLPACQEISHGDSLEQVMLGLHEANVEYDATFTLDGSKIGEWTNFAEQSVAYELPNWSGDSLISVHNHPHDDSGFSAEDFVSMIGSREWCSILITKKRVFVLLASPSCWELDSNIVEQRYIRSKRAVMKSQKNINMAIRTAAIETAYSFGFHMNEYRFSRRNCEMLAKDILKEAGQLMRDQRRKERACSLRELTPDTEKIQE